MKFDIASIGDSFRRVVLGAGEEKQSKKKYPKKITMPRFVEDAGIGQNEHVGHIIAIEKTAYALRTAPNAYQIYLMAEMNSTWYLPPFYMEKKFNIDRDEKLLEYEGNTVFTFDETISWMRKIDISFEQKGWLRLKDSREQSDYGYYDDEFDHISHVVERVCS